MRTMMHVLILTRKVNGYDQEGEYFVSVFGSKPTHQQLTELAVPKNRLRHVLSGGGRVEDEDEWFHLRPHTIEI